ncbi:putative nicotinate-nucleotide adenylyltransferase [Dissulfurispira thermophila]|uniref:Nicotinic acid mononucleotide adenylyltransferase n=2 Tax=root TaxID=1 RepID=A0A5J4L1Y5_9ZZZZ|nr:nicotinate-nucleotide adenylyltransferase [Dissulfurispira thermophila]BCB97088.1 putative nicotinate-nucleotide adenylyltransferase [Dissulfurispira thermophila]
MRLGIFGGTFNPIHFGHLRAAEEVREKLNLHKVIFMPSGNPPLKTLDLIEASHRYTMTRLATASNVDFVVSDIEVRQTKKSYTVNTIQMLYDIYPDDELFFILGIDAFLDISNWWQPDVLISLIDFILVTRPGYGVEDILKSPYINRQSCHCEEQSDEAISSNEIFQLKSGKKAFVLEITPIGISSTEIRRLLKEDKSIKYLVPEIVEDYIYKYKLYPNGIS